MFSPRAPWLGAVAGIALALGGAVAARAQSLPRIDLDFSNPGARSLGFGGAFVGLADDATASFANPAGLVQLTRPEVAVEGRWWNVSTSFFAGGRIDGEPTGRGIDTTNGLRIGRAGATETGPSFGAAVYPHGRWTLAVFGHRLARLDMASRSQGFFQGDAFLPRTPGTLDRVDVRLESAGVAAAWRFTDRLSAGVSVTRVDGTVQAESSAFLWDADTVSSLYGPITFRPERELATTRLDVRDSAEAISAGILWSASDRVFGGVSYRHGAALDGEERFSTLPAAGGPAETFVLPAQFRVPDLFSAGGAFRSRAGTLTLSGEVDRLGYADLLRVQGTDDVEPVVRSYRDSWQLHVGGEYALIDRRPVVAMRVGSWVETHSNDLEHDRLAHFAAGLGVASDHWQLDLAADVSAVTDTAALSLIYTF